MENQTMEPQAQNQALDPSKNNMSIATLVLGICAFVLGWLYVGIPCGIVGIILGIKSLKSEKKTLSIIGIVGSGLGILGGIIMIILVATIGAAYMSLVG